MKKKKQVTTIALTDIIKILKQYKLSIFFITTLATLLSAMYLYSTPSIYNAYAIIKVKPDIKTKAGEVIDNRPITMKLKDVAEEITLLKTFKVNSPALDKINLRVQYYQTQGYKKVELYDDVPLEVSNIEIYNEKTIGKKIAIIPQRNGFKLKYFPSFKEKIQHLLFKKKFFSLEDNETKPYNIPIETKFFKCTINQLAAIDKPIFFVLNGDKRSIFENNIKKRLTIKQLEKDTSLIKITFEDNIDKRARLYIDALSQNFMEQSIQTKNRQINKTSQYINSELQDIRNELKASEEKLEAYQVSKNIIEPSIQAKNYIQKLSDIEIQISENKLKRKLISNLISFVQNNDNLIGIAPSLGKLGDKSTLDLITKLQDYKLQEEEYIQEYTDAYPKLITVRRQIQNIRTRIQSNLRNLFDNIEYQTSNIIERKNKYELEMKSLPSKERQLINIKRNYEVTARMYEYLLKKKSESKIIQLAALSDYQIIDNAYNSKVPINKTPTLVLGLGSMLGFIIGSILALLRHGKNKNIKSKEEVEELTDLPIYGTIPFSKQKGAQLLVNKEVKSPFTESFRTLRTNLQFMNKENKSMSILITSTIAGEGKSTTAANLATILSKAKYKTILVNLDLRKPTLHKFFELDNRIGVSSYLNSIRKTTIEDIIFATEFANLDVIPSGPIPLEPSELIISKKLPAMLEELKESYDYVIIDSAPIGIVTDTKNIMQHTDLNLMIVREDYAQHDFISTIEEMIEKYQFKNIGLLINASKEKGGEYGYGYSYEYGD